MWNKFSKSLRGFFFLLNLSCVAHTTGLDDLIVSSRFVLQEVQLSVLYLFHGENPSWYLIFNAIFISWLNWTTEGINKKVDNNHGHNDDNSGNETNDNWIL